MNQLRFADTLFDPETSFKDDPIDFIIAEIQQLDCLELNKKVDAINKIREAIHQISPFNSEPVDFVKWVKNSAVHANDYNPNSVAPPEMELLRVSISADGYTQPIVSMPHENEYEVIDGFHRHRVGKECSDIQSRVHGYLPLVQIRQSQYDKSARMASTVRHNRARGKHKVEAMSDMVIELKRRNWSDDKICRELGMDKDEVLRLCQISGLAEIFSGQEFSKAWEPEGSFNPDDFDDISGEHEDYIETEIEVRTANTDDENRIFHTFDKWECNAAGFYETKPPKGMNADDCKTVYRDLLTNIPEFDRALNRVITEWKHSCEHYLTNLAMNRIAWMGQAALCIEKGIPSEFRGGYGLLTEEQQLVADQTALKAINSWMHSNGRDELTMEQANPNRQAEIY
jgi:ParB-like chromosome segregation protein Spo0J